MVIHYLQSEFAAAVFSGKDITVLPETKLRAPLLPKSKCLSG
jgi:hypothetical protein